MLWVKAMSESDPTVLVVDDDPALRESVGRSCDLSAWMSGYLRPFPTSSNPNRRTVIPASSSTLECPGEAAWICSANSRVRMSESRSFS
jgi:hypothetical protein